MGSGLRGAVEAAAAERLWLCAAAPAPPTGAAENDGCCSREKWCEKSPRRDDRGGECAERLPRPEAPLLKSIASVPAPEACVKATLLPAPPPAPSAPPSAPTPSTARELLPSSWGGNGRWEMLWLPERTRDGCGAAAKGC
jgi:hypothetical protein